MQILFKNNKPAKTGTSPSDTNAKGESVCHTIIIIAAMLRGKRARSPLNTVRNIHNSDQSHNNNNNIKSHHLSKYFVLYQSLLTFKIHYNSTTFICYTKNFILFFGHTRTHSTSIYPLTKHEIYKF